MSALFFETAPVNEKLAQCFPFVFRWKVVANLTCHNSANLVLDIFHFHRQATDFSLSTAICKRKDNSWRRNKMFLHIINRFTHIINNTIRFSKLCLNACYPSSLREFSLTVLPTFSAYISIYAHSSLFLLFLFFIRKYIHLYLHTHTPNTRVCTNTHLVL